MTSSTEISEPAIDALARRTGFTADAVASMVRSIRAGRGRMAQFDHPEFGGPGQWMSGGMLMISDFSDRALHRRIAQLCDAIVQDVDLDATSAEQPGPWHDGSAGASRRERAHVRGDWWPAALGAPQTSGAQNDTRYAWFADARRLAIEEAGAVTLYDTGDHRIAGVSQQQGGHRTLAFSSQHGVVDLAALPVVSIGGEGTTSSAERRDPGDPVQERPATKGTPSDPFVALEKLAGLHARGILSDDEFAKKKSELLARL